jgi:hypothetical protein
LDLFSCCKAPTALPLPCISTYFTAGKRAQTSAETKKKLKRETLPFTHAPCRAPPPPPPPKHNPTPPKTAKKKKKKN